MYARSFRVFVVAVIVFTITGCNDTFLPLSSYEKVEVRINHTLGFIGPGEQVVFSSTVSGSAAPFSFLWEFDGQAPDLKAPDPGPVSFNAAGEYTVRVTVSDDAGSAASDTVKIGVGTIRFVPIPAGTFEMGAHVVSEITNGLPVHVVRVSAFWMSTYEITNMLYCEFLNEHGNKDAQGNECINIVNSRIAYNNTAYSVVSGCENHPVTCVTWYGARAFCDWLSDNYLGHYSLPTEAQWEYAARGGEYYYKYPWGTNSIGIACCNYYNGCSRRYFS